MLPLVGRVAGVGAHQIGFVLFDAELIHAGNRAPEADKIVDLAGVALHAHHLHHDLKLGSPLMLSFAKRTKLSRTFSKLRALAVELEGLLLRAIEAESDLLQRRIEHLAGVALVEEGAIVERSVEMLWRWQNSMRSKMSLSMNGSPSPISIMCSADAPDSRTSVSKMSCDMSALAARGSRAGTWGSRGCTWRCFDDVLDRQRRQLERPRKVSPQKFGAVPGPHAIT